MRLRDAHLPELGDRVARGRVVDIAASRLALVEFRQVSGQPLEAAFDVAAGGGQRREAARGREPDHLDDVVEHCAVAAEEREDAEIDVRRHAARSTRPRVRSLLDVARWWRDRGTGT